MLAGVLSMGLGCRPKRRKTPTDGTVGRTHGEFSFFSEAKRKVVLEGFVTGCLEKVEVRGRGAAHLLAHCAADCMTLISFQLARAGHEKEKVN